MEYYCGIDIGASAAKLVIIEPAGRIVARNIGRSGVDYAGTAEELLSGLCAAESLDRSQIVRSLSTGYGRDNVPWADGKMTEIACHGRGAYFHFHKQMTVIDIGAQDSKVIHLDQAGKRESFKMNRKCAAGTGAFIEEIAHRLSLNVSELNALAQRSTKEVSIGSFCTVFAATEILEKIRAGVEIADIVRGAFNSVVKRIMEMDRVNGLLVTTGGVVAHNPFLSKLLGQSLGTEAHVAPDAQYTGAFGAALFAAEQAQKPDS
ncbi:MAG: acyl-CoA dehydratase activase [Planctomycetota bacterium]|jgi:predicted CoA-substrate-specific enzyme activase